MDDLFEGVLLLSWPDSADASSAAVLPTCTLPLLCCLGSRTHLLALLGAGRRG